jgi:hypothetical protein
MNEEKNAIFRRGEKGRKRPHATRSGSQEFPDRKEKKNEKPAKDMFHS